jgi:hypothetical protein
MNPALFEARTALTSASKTVGVPIFLRQPGAPPVPSSAAT